MDEKRKGAVQHRQWLKQLLPYFELLAVVLIFAILTKGRILGLDNLILIWKQSAVLIICCVGATFVLAHGNLDFSIGANIALICGLGCIAGNIHPALFLPVILICAVVLDLLMCYIHISCKVPAIVVSWAMMFCNQGIMTYLSAEFDLRIPSQFIFLDNNLTYILAVLVVVAAGTFLLNYTKLGKYNKAIGSNPINARMNGIRVRTYKYLAYLVCGVCIGIASVLTMARGRSVTVLTASSMSVNVLIAVVLGGLPLGGGVKARIHAGVIGALILMILTNGLTMIGVENTWIGAIKGLVFLVAVIATFDRKSMSVII